MCSLPCTRTHWKFGILGFLLIPFSWRSPLSAGTTDHPAAPGSTGTEIPQPLQKFIDKKMIPECFFPQILPNLSILLFQLSAAEQQQSPSNSSHTQERRFHWISMEKHLVYSCCTGSSILLKLCSVPGVHLSYLKNFLSLGLLTTLFFLFFNVTLTSHKKEFNKGRLCTPSETPTPVEIGMLGEMPSYTMSEVHIFGVLLIFNWAPHRATPRQFIFWPIFNLPISSIPPWFFKLKQITSI